MRLRKILGFVSLSASALFVFHVSKFQGPERLGMFPFLTLSASLLVFTQHSLNSLIAVNHRSLANDHLTKASNASPDD